MAHPRRVFLERGNHHSELLVAALKTAKERTMTDILTAEAIQVGKLYRAKRPLRQFGEIMNDRVVLYVSPTRERVQYDSSAVPDGRRYPTVPMDRFLKWASHEVHADGDK